MSYNNFYKCNANKYFLNLVIIELQIYNVVFKNAQYFTCCFPSWNHQDLHYFIKYIFPTVIWKSAKNLFFLKSIRFFVKTLLIVSPYKSPFIRWVNPCSLLVMSQVFCYHFSSFQSFVSTSFNLLLSPVNFSAQFLEITCYLGP